MTARACAPTIALVVLGAVFASRAILQERVARRAGVESGDRVTVDQQAPSDTPWRDDPLLQGQFREGFPDDLVVIVHDGGPMVGSPAPESVWVEVVAVAAPGCYAGRVLHQPIGLQTVGEGDEVQFMVKPGWGKPVQVRKRYFDERPDWEIGECSGCGFDELFDAPSDLLAAGAVPPVFETPCPMCGLQREVRRKGDG